MEGRSPGKVFETLVDGQYANPVMVVDEIDKTGDMRMTPWGPLYNLLGMTPHTPSSTTGLPRVPIDASQVIWVAANDARGIPRPHPEPDECV